MTQKIDNTKINAAVDLLIENDVDFSNALGSPSINVDSLNHRNPSSIKESCIAFGI